MEFLERYTSEICSELARLAERRHWNSWSNGCITLETVLEDLELTYHLHLAAEAAGVRAGFPPMPAFPIKFRDESGVLDPAAFLSRHARTRLLVNGQNQMDNCQSVAA